MTLHAGTARSEGEFDVNIRGDHSVEAKSSYINIGRSLRTAADLRLGGTGRP